MIRQLLALQFPLFYVPLLVITLGIYGFNSRESLALLYLMPVALYLVCRLSMPLWRSLLASSIAVYTLVLTGIISALLLYYPLHMGTVDERSSIQAVLTGILGCVSLLLSIRSAEASPGSGTDSDVGLVMLILAPAWALSFFHQHIGFWVLAGFFALGLFHNNNKKTAEHAGNENPLPSTKLLSYGIFLACLECSLIIWDLRENREWAWQLGLIMAAAATGFLMAGKHRASVIPVLLAGLANIIVCSFFPAYVLSPLHSLAAGAGLGVLYYWRQQQPAGNSQHLGLATPVFLGFLIGYALSANLQALDYRLILLLPLLFFLRPLQSLRSQPNLGNSLNKS